MVNMKRLHLALIIAAAILLAVSAGWGFVWIYAERDTIPGGASAIPDGAGLNDPAVEAALEKSAALSLGGLTIDEALRKLNTEAADLERLPLTIKAKDGGQAKTWTLGELGVSVDVQQARSAINRLRKGGIWDKAKYRKQFPRELKVVLSWNKTTFASGVRRQWGWIDADEPVNAKRTITAGDKVVYTAGKDAYKLDTGKLFSLAAAKLGDIIASRWNDSAADKSRGGGGGSPRPAGESGQSDGPNSGLPEPGEAEGITLGLQLRVVHPDVTLERLKEQGVERKIASFTTDFSTSGPGRAYNVSMTARTLNDWELAPGEVFDYRKVIEATRQKYGYRKAPVILNGELTPGIGGGICQVSSTLYNAALRAGLEMVERRNHSLPVSYLPKGQDATFAEGSINFRFKNTTGSYLIIRTAVAGRQLTVKLFGAMPQNISYSIDSRTVEVIDPPVREVPSAAVQKGRQLLLTAGKRGYVVETYRTMKKDGKTVSRQRISRDTYPAQPAVYAVAPGTPGIGGGGKGKQLLEDGVSE